MHPRNPQGIELNAQQTILVKSKLADCIPIKLNDDAFIFPIHFLSEISKVLNVEIESLSLIDFTPDLGSLSERRA